MTNQEKAEEIVNAFFIGEVSEENEQVIREMLNKAALEAMQWKDEQHKQEKQKLIDKAESVCAEMFLRIESELFNAGVKNTNNRKEIEDALEIGYKYFKQAMKGE